jgi:hypothetical protein
MISGTYLYQLSHFRASSGSFLPNFPSFALLFQKIPSFWQMISIHPKLRFMAAQLKNLNKQGENIIMRVFENYHEKLNISYVLGPKKLGFGP